MFKYGSFKLLLLKIFLGIFLISFSLFLIISIFTYNSNDPGLGKIVVNSEIINFVRSLTGTNNTIKVAFGTEGGLFHKEVGIPTVVCGPGSMLQGHKPNEFITVEQMDRCDLMMANLLTSLK